MPVVASQLCLRLYCFGLRFDLLRQLLDALLECACDSRHASRTVYTASILQYERCFYCLVLVAYAAASYAGGKLAPIR